MYYFSWSLFNSVGMYNFWYPSKIVLLLFVCFKQFIITKILFPHKTVAITAHLQSSDFVSCCNLCFNPLNAELNPTCHLLTFLWAHHIFHLSRIRVKVLFIFLPIPRIQWILLVALWVFSFFHETFKTIIFRHFEVNLLSYGRLAGPLYVV